MIVAADGRRFADVDVESPHMRILLVSDLHYTLRQLDWVASVAGDYEVVVLAGDHLDIASIVEPDAQIAVVLEYLSRMAAKTTVVASSGNHDLNARNAHDERAASWLAAAREAGVFVDGTRLVTERVLVTVCPWWDGPRTCEAVDRQLAEDATLVDDRLWIWVYHAPPDGSPTSWTGKRHYGDEELVAWIERHRPGIVLCGHVHQSPFESDGSWIDRIGSTLVLNAGRQRGPVPAFIDLDTDVGLVSWRSVDGVEEKSFAAG
jgi:Icc-related predicted phosphoesterase